MYQVSLSVCENKSSWFYEIQDVLYIRLKKFNGIMATQLNGKRLNISIACENEFKNEVASVLKDCFSDMFGSVVKHEYLTDRLNLPLLNRPSYNLLLHTLVAFDRENEREIIGNKLSFNGNGVVALDGVFYFLLSELKTRWDEIANLAMDNAQFLNNEDTLNELLRFLISAINPKIQKLEVSQRDNRYSVTGTFTESNFEYNIISTEQLMIYLIDIAPLEISLHGKFTDKNLCKRLVSIFDAKHDDTLTGNIQR